MVSLNDSFAELAVVSCWSWQPTEKIATAAAIPSPSQRRRGAAAILVNSSLDPILIAHCALIAMPGTNMAAYTIYFSS
jgi:hypothetical protein